MEQYFAWRLAIEKGFLVAAFILCGVAFLFIVISSFIDKGKKN